MKTSIKAIKEDGAHCQCAISYTTSKVHTVEYFVKLSKKMEEMGLGSKNFDKSFHRETIG